MTTMVAVEGLSRRFGHLLAVDGISLTVDRGEVLGILGPNGSGKSTTMKMVTGFLAPSAGRVEVCGIDVAVDPVAAQRRLGYLPEGAPAYGDITTAAYLRFIADVRRLFGAAGRRAIEDVVERTNIAPVLHQPIETLSKGFKRRVGLAQALLHDPDVLILDEPTDGLDPNQKFEVRTLIREMSREKAIVISTHILEEVETVCSRALIISEGRIVADGTPEHFERGSRLFNAVSLSLPREHAAPVRAELEALPGVSTVEVNEAEAGGALRERSAPVRAELESLPGVSTVEANEAEAGGALRERSAPVRAELEAPSGVSTVEANEAGGALLELTVVPAAGEEILSTIAVAAREREWPVERLRPCRGLLDEVFRGLTAGGVRRDPAPLRPTPRESAPAPRIADGLRDVLTICRRELAGYLSTPIAYVFVVVFLTFAGALTFFLGSFLDRGQASLDGFFQFHPWLYLFLVPAIAMRLWAEERKSGSIELLLTLPVTTFSTVLGKFAAAWIVAGAGLALTGTFWLTVNYLGSPDNGVIAVGYAGSFVMAGSYLAISAFVSALTKNQVIAFIVAAALCFAFTASGLGVVLEFFAGWAPTPVLDTVANLSFLDHFRDISRGVVDVRDAVFFVSTIVFFLFANVVAVELRKNA